MKKEHYKNNATVHRVSVSVTGQIFLFAIKEKASLKHMEKIFQSHSVTSLQSYCCTMGREKTAFPELIC